VPYPQYGAILQTSTDARTSHYKSLQIRLQRPFSHGISFLGTYAYSTQGTQAYWDIQDEYDGKLTWLDGAYSAPGGTGTALSYAIDPKHRFTGAASYAIPVGRGKTFGNGMGSGLNAIFGGWQLSGSFNHMSGQVLNFGTMVAPASVTKIGKIGSGNLWFDTTGFAVQPAFTRRTNPWYYEDLTGPGFTNIDLSLAKRVNVTERYKIELRFEAYNAINEMNWANPTLTVSASDFGRTNAQASGYYGRQVQYSAKFFF
jgi:hypothetical protein